MPKISKDAGESYFPEGPNIRETDDPAVMAVASDRRVAEANAETARLRGELRDANRARDEAQLAAGERFKQDDQKRAQESQQDDQTQGADWQGDHPSGTGTKTFSAPDATVERNDAPASSATTSSGTGTSFTPARRRTSTVNESNV
jgi:hypothetical protein